MKNVIWLMQMFLVSIMRFICKASSSLVTLSYKLLFYIEWGFPYGKTPFYMDHNIDIYYLWKRRGHMSWMLRGGLSALAIRCFESPRILELGCGDGFYTKFIYSKINKNEVIAMDKDSRAIKRANKTYSASNIKYVKNNFLDNFPLNDNFTNVVWDASINFFDIKEIEQILNEIKSVLKNNKGILSGSAIVLNKEVKWNEYKHLFNSSEEIFIILKKHFNNVCITSESNAESGYVFFYASDGELPFKN